MDTQKTATSHCSLLNAHLCSTCGIITTSKAVCPLSAQSSLSEDHRQLLAGSRSSAAFKDLGIPVAEPQSLGWRWGDQD